MRMRLSCLAKSNTYRYWINGFISNLLRTGYHLRRFDSLCIYLHDMKYQHGYSAKFWGVIDMRVIECSHQVLYDDRSLEAIEPLFFRELENNTDSRWNTSVWWAVVSYEVEILILTCNKHICRCFIKYYFFCFVKIWWLGNFTLCKMNLGYRFLRY